jgi:hypothetical protein
MVVVVVVDGGGWRGSNEYIRYGRWDSSAQAASKRVKVSQTLYGSRSHTVYACMHILTALDN